MVSLQQESQRLCNWQPQVPTWTHFLWFSPEREGALGEIKPEVPAHSSVGISVLVENILVSNCKQPIQSLEKYVLNTQYVPGAAVTCAGAQS